MIFAVAWRKGQEDNVIAAGLEADIDFAAQLNVSTWLVELAIQLRLAELRGRISRNDFFLFLCFRFHGWLPYFFGFVATAVGPEGSALSTSISIPKTSASWLGRWFLLARAVVEP